MKTKSYIFVLALCMLVCVSCNNNEPAVKSPYDVPLYIVKFGNSDYQKMVIASHAITDHTHNNFDEQAGVYNYVFDNTCYKFMYYPGYSTSDEYHLMRGIAGSTPYITLSDGYLLVDWRWQDYLPVSYRYLYMNTRNIKYNSQNHFFFMNISWEDVTSLAQTWQSADVYKPFEVKEWRTISCQSMERYLKGDKSPTAYLETLKNVEPKKEGVNYDNQYNYVAPGSSFDETAYYKYKDGGEKQYHQYASMADSLYTVYAKGLNELIKTNKLKTWTYEIAH